MSTLLKEVSDSVKAGARDIALAAGLGAGAVILASIALVFFAYAGYSALHLAMPAWAAALIVALVFLSIAVILALFMRRAAEAVGESDLHLQEAEIVPPWTAYGIPKEVPVDRILQQAKAAGLSLLGRMTARYSVQTLLPALVPIGVGLMGYVAARRVSQKMNDRRLPRREIRRG